jgi:hypothetical protein
MESHDKGPIKRKIWIKTEQGENTYFLNLPR